MPKFSHAFNHFFTHHRWPWLVTTIILTSLLFVFSSASWFWYEEQRSTSQRQLSLDLFWLENNISGTLDNHTKILNNWSGDLIPAAPATVPNNLVVNDFLNRITQFGKNNPAALSIDYLNKDRQRISGYPVYEDRPPHLPPISDPYINEALDRSLKQAKSTYSRVIEQFAPLLVLVVPISSEGENYGFVLVTYDLDQILLLNIPWWLIKRYDVSLVDREQKQLFPRETNENSNRESNEDIFNFPFGSEETGLHLRAQRPHSNQPKFLLFGLAIAILLLGAFIVFLLRVLQRWLGERRAVQVALAKELRFREAMERSLITGLLAFDQDARIIYVNPALCELLGRTEQELIGSSAPFSFWPDGQRDHCQNMHQAMLRGELPSSGCNLEFMHSNGKLLSIRMFASALVDEHGKTNGWMVSLYDTTSERLSANMVRERDELLQYTSRLSSLAEFASGIAHELNQPLAAIANYSAAAESFLANKDAPKNRLLEAIQRMGAESRRAGEIVHSMRSFIQRREIKHEAWDLCALILEPLLLLEPLLQRSQIKVALEIAETSIWIDADKVMLEQVVFNLLRNAIEALENAPGIRSEKPITLLVCQEDNHALLKVSDRGTGIADADKLFQAFYTTKAEGMGLGLAICRTVIESHGGRLWAENNTGGGASFIFRLPLHQSTTNLASTQ